MKQEILAFREKHPDIRYIEVYYNGCGDSGDIEEVYAYRDGEFVWATRDGVSIEVAPDGLLDQLHKFGNDLVQTYVAWDWYNNDGGYGRLYVDLVELKFNDVGTTYVEQEVERDGVIGDIK